MYVEPLQPIFKTMPLGLREWALCIVAAGIPTFLMGAGSVWGGRRNRRRMGGTGRSVPKSTKFSA